MMKLSLSLVVLSLAGCTVETTIPSSGGTGELTFAREGKSQDDKVYRLFGASLSVKDANDDPMLDDEGEPIVIRIGGVHSAQTLAAKLPIGQVSVCLADGWKVATMENGGWVTLGGDAVVGPKCVEATVDRTGSVAALPFQVNGQSVSLNASQGELVADVDISQWTALDFDGKKLRMQQDAKPTAAVLFVESGLFNGFHLDDGVDDPTRETKPFKCWACHNRVSTEGKPIPDDFKMPNAKLKALNAADVGNMNGPKATFMKQVIVPEMKKLLNNPDLNCFSCHTRADANQ